MKRISLIGMVLLATLGLSGVVTASASAACKETVKHDGNYNRIGLFGTCTEPVKAGTGRYAEVLKSVKSLGSNEECAEVESGSGIYSNEKCEGKEEAGGNYIRVVENEAPFWSTAGARLGAGATHFITAKIYKEGEKGNELKLETPSVGVVVSCTGVNLPFETGVIIGSEGGGAPGTNNEVVHFTGCTVTGNGEKCAVEGKEITTKPLRSELVANVESRTIGKKLLVEFAPFEGSTFATLKFKAETGGKCTFTETPVEGSTAAEVLNEKEKAVELPNTLEEGTSWLTRFPATGITEVWLMKEGPGNAVKVGLKAFSLAASREVGTALILLAKVTGTTLESEETKWSPLP
jgi:hypothetical protein